jgi:hypothetical protein
MPSLKKLRRRVKTICRKRKARIRGPSKAVNSSHTGRSGLGHRNTDQQIPILRVRLSEMLCLTDHFSLITYHFLEKGG